MKVASCRWWLAAAALGCAAPLVGQSKEQSAAPKPAEGGREAPKKRRPVVSDMSGFELLDPAKLKDKPMVTGATRSLFGPKSPVPLAPHLGRVYGRDPVFVWRHEGRARRFAFTLTDEADKVLHAAEVEGFQYAWPAGAPRLEAGKTYYWIVRPSEPANAPAATAGIVVVTAAERARIEKALGARGGESYEAGLARARALAEERLWYDVVAACSDLIGRSPERAEAHELRGSVYAQIPATQALADEDLARAEQLAKE